MEKWLQRLPLRWLDRIQSGLLLPTARTLYLAVAGLCVATAIIGLLAAALYQLGAFQTASQKRLPEVVSDRPTTIDYSKLESRLSPPTNVRFIVDSASLTLPAAAGQVVGHFEADTPNGMASFPEGFQIIGGRDGELFDGADGGEGRTVLRIRSPVAEEINQAADGPKTVRSRSFQVQILAHDAAGNRAGPIDVDFGLTYAPAGTPTPPDSVAGEADVPADLKAIALRVAHIADPTHATPDYFNAFHYAIAEPQRCDAVGDAAFVAHYGRSFARVRTRLTRDKLPTFYLGVCEAWRDALERAAQATAASAAARAQVLAENAAAQNRAAMGRMAAISHRNSAMVLVGGAILAFMTIALFLAFLAMEGHSNAVRLAVEVIAAQRRPPEDEPPGLTTPTAGR